MSARAVGRYLLCEELASGGTAKVMLGLQPVGSRVVAIKELYPELARDEDFASALVDEGRTQSRVQHPNVAAAIDVVREGGALLLVMEYVHGASLAELFEAAKRSQDPAAWPSIGVVAAVLAATLRGLHAAHEARSASGAPLDIVHRDVSPHNVLVGIDGSPRVVDFGIAHAAERSQITRDGSLKGKPGYMAPEQLAGDPLTRAVDVYAAGVVLWELATHERLFPGDNFVAVAHAALDGHIDPPSAVRPGLPAAVDALVARAVARDPRARFPTAAAFADEIERLLPIAPAAEVAAWVGAAARETIRLRSEMLDRVRASAEPVALDSPPRRSRVRTALMIAVGGALLLGGVAMIVETAR